MGAADGYVEISKDDEQARRIASLALAFMSSETIRDETIWRQFYPNLSKADSYRTAFRRDRAALTECGITVSRVDGPETLWRVDSASFVESTELSEEDAMALDVACLPLVDDQDFPYGSELRIALSKIDDAFDCPALISLPAEERVPSRQLAILQDCSLLGVAARIDYTRADGVSVERLVAPYGFFGMRGHLYLVAPAIDGNGRVIDGSTRTYRIDRVRRASKVAGTTFEVPEDFDARDWQKLPFQLGPAVCEASFAVPARRIREFSQVSQGKGTIRLPDGEATAPATWLVEVSSVEDAASWAIAEDVTPLSPPELVAAWRERLGGVISHG
ncbi:MAG: WYL domain-containing protein [Olsenella sp.]|nr:WYL domain-containing protein [Olsenella sp.]